MTTDFSSLLADSTSLLATQNGSFSFPASSASASARISSGTPSLKRSLHELSLASRDLARGTSATSSAEALLCREGKGFDSSDLTRGARALGSLAVSATGGGESPEDDRRGYLESNHDEVISRALEVERARMERDLEKLVSDRLLKEEKRDRDRVLRELAGYRRVVTPVVAWDGQQESNSAGNFGGGIVLMANEEREGPRRDAVAEAFGGSTRCTPYAGILFELNDRDGSSNKKDDETLAWYFSECQSLAESTGDKVCANAWDLVGTMVLRAPSALRNAEVCRVYCLAALVHLCGQFRNHVVARARKETLKGNTVPPSNGGFSHDVHVYVSSDKDNDDVWRKVYCCLRSGDVVAARSFLSSMGTSTADTAVFLVSNALATVPHQNANAAAVEAFFTTHFSPVNNDATQMLNPHRTAVLALLSQKPLPRSVVGTIEDYLFSALHCAIRSPDPSNRIVELGNHLRKWGPSHFSNPNGEHPEAAAWSYVTPLLCAQQFETALGHLASVHQGRYAEKALPLALGLDRAGVPLLDLQPPQSNASTPAPQTQNILSRLILSHASTLRSNSNPRLALEYLARLPNSNHKHAEISKLVSDSAAFEILAGRVDDHGARSGSASALDRHFPQRKISAILADAAELSFRKGRVRDAAELLALAGRYGALLALFNEKLAGSFESAHAGGEVGFWKEAALQFHAKYMNGRTHVVEVLDAEDNLGVVHTFQLVLNLLVFFDKCRNRDWEEADALMDKLQLLPAPSALSSQNTDMAHKIDAYHSLDASIKNGFHHIIVATLDMIHHQHAHLKSTNRNSANRDLTLTQALEQRMEELRKKARVIVTFAGLCRVGGGAGDDRIVRMEAAIV